MTRGPLGVDSWQRYLQQRLVRDSSPVKPQPLVATSMDNVAMKPQGQQVGIRELKNSLSGYIRRVAAGESIVVTDRGREVARLVPAAWPPGLAEMARRGELIPASRRRRRTPRPVPHRAGDRQLSDIVIADRHR